MCIIIDSCVFGSVFKIDNADHKNYKAVYDWIINGKGKIVFGGTKYTKELSTAFNYLKLFNLLKDQGKAVILDKGHVDKEEKRIKKITPKKFNDHHLIAIVAASGCTLLCSSNTSDFGPILDKQYYPTGRKPPKIYSQNSTSRHKQILHERNIAHICKPCVRLNKKQKETLKKQT